MPIEEEENYMDNQSNCANPSIEENCTTIEIRVGKDDAEVIKKLEGVNDINDYILSLIRMDIKAPRSYHSIDDSVKIDFPVSHTMQDLIDKAERADLNDDYPVYMNWADAIDSQGKLEATRHQITDGQWMMLQRRYLL